MVDFNNETSVSTPATNIVKILVLEARYNSLLALEFYNSKISAGINSEQATLRARLGTWFMEHQAYLKRTLIKEEDKKLYKKIKDNIFFKKNNLNNEDILEAVEYLNKIIDLLKINKLDTRQQYDTTDVEEDNKQNEY
jgi:hypothetical protein